MSIVFKFLVPLKFRSMEKMNYSKAGDTAQTRKQREWEEKGVNYFGHTILAFKKEKIGKEFLKYNKNKTGYCPGKQKREHF